MKKGKIIGLVILLVFLGAVGFGVSRMVQNPEKYQSTNQNDIEVVFDAPSFSRISTDALIQKMGEADSVEDYASKTSKGNFAMKIYSYKQDNSSVEFIVCEDAVVRIHYFPNEPMTYKNETEMFGMFGISPGNNIKKTADTGTVLRFQSVSDKVGGFDAYDINNKSFGYAYITYNWNYFE